MRGTIENGQINVKESFLKKWTVCLEGVLRPPRLSFPGEDELFQPKTSNRFSFLVSSSRAIDRRLLWMRLQNELLMRSEPIIQ
jgi:hypothetical protein